ncbi:MAG TPA: histidine phosphatase family protein [Trueperaceae bacterium]
MSAGGRGASEPPSPGDRERLAAADVVLVRHARPVLRAGVPARDWLLDPGAVPACHALAAEVDRLLEGTGRRVTRLLSSTEPKAVATAAALAEAWGLRGPGAHPGLDEHRRGVLPIVGDVEWRETIGRLFARPDELVLGEETASQARARFAAAMVEVAAQGDGAGLTAVVTHATVMTLLLAEPNHLAPLALWGSLLMPDALFVSSSGWRLLGRAWPDRP